MRTLAKAWVRSYVFCYNGNMDTSQSCLIMFVGFLVYFPNPTSSTCVKNHLSVLAILTLDISGFYFYAHRCGTPRVSGNDWPSCQRQGAVVCLSAMFIGSQLADWEWSGVGGVVCLVQIPLAWQIRTQGGRELGTGGTSLSLIPKPCNRHHVEGKRKGIVHLERERDANWKLWW